MENILLSIILPTRGRLETLKFTLNSLLKLSNKNIEIIICDNNSDDGTELHVTSIKDGRIRYIKSDEKLSMPQNFERGLLNAKGEYILTLGDDDLIIQNNLDLALSSIINSNSELIYWNRWYFYWSSFPDISNSGTFGISVGRQYFNIDTKLLLTLSYYGFVNFQYLPSIYNSIIKKSFLDKYKSYLRGHFFPDYVIAVDLYSSLIFSSMDPKAIYLESPVSVSGISHRSNGMSVYTDQKEYKKFLLELGLNEFDDLIPDNLIGKIIPVNPHGRNVLSVMMDYYNALERELKFSMKSHPNLDLFTKNFITKFVINGDIEFNPDFLHLKDQYSNVNNSINDDPLTYFYKIFNIPLPSLYTGRFNNCEATSLDLFNHLQEINFNFNNKNN